MYKRQDIMMDMTLSMLSPFPNNSIASGIADGFVDVAQTELFYTPKAQVHTQNIGKSKSSIKVATSSHNIKSTSNARSNSRLRIALY